MEELNLKNILKGRAGAFLAVSLLLLGLAFFLNRKYLHDLNDPRQIRRQVQGELFKKEARMEKLFDQVMAASKGHQFQPVDSILGEHLYQEEGMIIFITRDDSLCYWSDNSVPYIQDWSVLEPGNRFVRLKDGWYLLKVRHQEDHTLSGIILVKKDYPYQNAYLENNFLPDFGNLEHVDISLEKGDIDILSSEGSFLFSLVLRNSGKVTEEQMLLLFAICIAALMFLISSMFFIYRAMPVLKNRELLMLLAFTLDLLLLRWLFLALEIPAFLYDSRLFGPGLFATSWFEPSLGDLVVNRLMLLGAAYAFFLLYKLNYSRLEKKIRILIHILQISVSAVLYFGLFQSFRQLVGDSSILLNLNSIAGIDIYAFLGFTAMTASIMAVFFITGRLITNVWLNSADKREHLWSGAVVLALALAGPLLGLPCHWPLCLIFGLYLLSYFYFLGRKDSIRQLPAIVLFIILFAVSSTFMLNRFNNAKESEYRRMIASTLSAKRDPLLEYEFSKVEAKIIKDPAIAAWLSKPDAALTDTEEASLSRYLDENYFTSFWNKYEMLVTVCDSLEVLNIQPENYLINCAEYFNRLIERMGVPTINRNLFYIDNQSLNNNYIAIIRPSDSLVATGASRRIYVELFFKSITESGLGYPELLIDREANLGSDVAGYSYSHYHEGRLIYKYGDYFYHLDFTPYERKGADSYFVNLDGYSHYVTSTGPGNWLIVSRKLPAFIDTVAPFSYLFLFFSLFTLIFIGILALNGGYRRTDMNFRNRFQAAIISIIMVSLIVLGFVTRAYIIDLNNKKNINYLTEKTYSVLVELEHKIGSYDSISPDSRGYVAELLGKFAQVFFSDINIYLTDGELYASSRPQIFEENLLSGKMNRQAYKKLAYDQSLLFIHSERIGKQEYLSAYIPFRNTDDRIIAYLNLPYFAKQDEMREEIADFLSAYINIYVLLIVLAILITILVSRYVTQPLQLIREKLRNLGYGKSNEKIEWKREDEIGELVAEYNRTLDKLARSAELLARSERESAWREMAKQVAHEIKNPLTPMKLSVQYLQKAWDDKAPDWEERLGRFTRTIIEQIDSLSQIATEFSDFAKMPVASFEKLDLLETARRSADLFHNVDNIKIFVNPEKSECYISADRQQMLRVFNNLINNSVQAIGNKENGRIDINIVDNGPTWRVEVADNGSGISDEQAKKIFSPSFTTKSGGMGLGLAMVRNILSGIGAVISFTSREGEGTSFFMEIPKLSE